jgi:gliding motility-associated-like protein
VSGGVGNYTYLWSSGGTSATELNLTVGSYIITVTDGNGCSLIDTAVVNSANAVTVTPSQTNITCFGNSDGSATVNPSGGQPPYTYAWSPFGGNNATATNLSSGTYTCTITDANGCTATQLFFIVEPAAITASINSLPVSCNGGSDGSATMNVSGGSPPFVFSWLPTGGNGSTANGLPAGTYTVLATDSSGCSTTQVFTISQPSALTVGTSPDTACAGGTATISATGNGGVGPYTYSWSSGGQSQTETVSPSVATTYTVVVTDSHGCSNTATVTVPVFQVPTAAFTTSAVNGIFTLASNPLCLNDASVNASSWYWNFNGQATSFQQSPCIVLSAGDTGPYCITLIASTSAGCLDTAETCIEVTDVSFSIPNVFTPNADGNNDVFIISNRGMKSLHCRIYDRWGVLIYEWDGTTGSWDGRTKNGKEAVDGVYYYAAFLEDYSGRTYDESGFVHLIRGVN